MVPDKSYGERSNDYRREFFKVNKPDKNGKYKCVYCGRKLPKEKITVDHLYPVHVAQKSRHIRKKMYKKGFDSVNDVENLVPACASCNKAKGTKMGIWILMGKLGKHRWYWVARKIVFFIFLLFIVYILIQLLR